jgi:hypothetical protein
MVPEFTAGHCRERARQHRVCSDDQKCRPEGGERLWNERPSGCN